MIKHGGHHTYIAKKRKIYGKQKVKRGRYKQKIMDVQRQL